MAFRAVLFDLDGTLIDSLHDIAEAANAVLQAEGFPAHPASDYRRFIGGGVLVLFGRALPREHTDDATIAKLAAKFPAAYERTWNVRSRLYEGIAELLDGLAARRYKMGVLSNKPDDFTRRYAEHFLRRWPFDVVLGAREDIPRKPDPTGALLAAKELGLPPSAILYVGDSATDMETAKRAGMVAVGVAWGFRPVEELKASGAAGVIEHPRELLEILDGRVPRHS